MNLYYWNSLSKIQHMMFENWIFIIFPRSYLSLPFHLHNMRLTLFCHHHNFDNFLISSSQPSSSDITKALSHTKSTTSRKSNNQVRKIFQLFITCWTFVSWFHMSYQVCLSHLAHHESYPQLPEQQHREKHINSSVKLLLMPKRQHKSKSIMSWIR